jgi:hypothetical protein
MESSVVTNRATAANGPETANMPAYTVVVTQFMGRSHFAEICVDGVPRHRLVGVPRFRTAPVSAEELTDEVKAVLNKRVRSAARKLYICPGDIIWPSAPSI